MGECCPAVRPEMRSLLLLLGLATLALAQRPGRPGGRPSPCSDGGRPTCADGSRPERPPRGQRGPPTCSDGSSPVCRTEAPPRSLTSLPGVDPALMEALQPVAEPAQSAPM